MKGFLNYFLWAETLTSEGFSMSISYLFQPLTETAKNVSQLPRAMGLKAALQVSPLSGFLCAQTRSPSPVQGLLCVWQFSSTGNGNRKCFPSQWYSFGIKSDESDWFLWLFGSGFDKVDSPEQVRHYLAVLFRGAALLNGQVKCLQTLEMQILIPWDFSQALHRAQGI